MAEKLKHTNGIREEALFGAGCFWCVEAIFSQLKGVDAVEPGYAGGYVHDPTYERVCTGETGHAEVCRITYDPSVITFAELLEVFWQIHDPTTVDRQGADIGHQYRSVIYYQDETQHELAVEMKEKLNASGLWEHPVVTEIAKAGVFYKAEETHHAYYANHSSLPYCSMVIRPKLDKFHRIFEGKIRQTDN